MLSLLEMAVAIQFYYYSINVNATWKYCKESTQLVDNSLKLLEDNDIDKDKTVMINFDYLNVYSEEKKELLDFIIESQQVASECIPIYYGEVKPYYIVTSPCVINNGDFTDDAQIQVMPLHKKFKDELTSFNESLYIQYLDQSD